MFCRERVAQLRDRREEIEAAGGRLAFVGSGSPQQAGAFADSEAGGLPVYSDADRVGFEAAGMKRSWGATLSLRLLRNAWRALRSGFRQARIEGDPWQQGGVVVIAAGDADPELVHEQIDDAGGDELDVDAVLRSLRGAGDGAPSTAC